MLAPTGPRRVQGSRFRGPSGSGQGQPAWRQGCTPDDDGVMTQNPVPPPNPYSDAVLSPNDERTWAVLAHVSALVAAILSVPLLLRRARRPAVAPPPRVLRDRVEVDSYGHITRRLTAQEIADEQERKPGRQGRSDRSP